ncbi:MAG: hypothetical protein Q9227_008813 [Pyrenula ochraceoflavens]
MASQSSDEPGAEPDNPILTALPPESDYITYLTILEYQLTPARLPSLQYVLENDSENSLTENIGWDLVHLLLPMLPQSQGCLDLVARKGNPREVIIRVTEALEGMGNETANAAEEQYDEESEALRTFEGEAERIHLGEMKLEGMPESDASLQEPPPQRSEDSKLENEPLHAADSRVPVATLQFESLAHMLSILHPRIKTKNPSRFLATSLPAVLRAYRDLINPSTTLAIVELLTKLSGTSRPALPPRISTTDASVPGSQAKAGETVTAPLPDPEGEEGVQDGEASDAAIVKKLIQAVALEVLEDFVLEAGSLTENGMEWCSRLREHLEPEKTVLGRKSVTERWREEQALKDKDVIVEKLVRLCNALSLNHPSTFNPILTRRSTQPTSPPPESTEEDQPATDYPTSPSAIPFPLTGTLFYLTALTFYSHFPPSSSSPPPPPSISTPLPIFPSLSHLLNSFTSTSPLPAHPPSTLDALLTLLSTSLHPSSSTIGPYPSTLPTFQQTIWHPLTHLSASHPSPTVRYHANLITSGLLHAHPSPTTRLEIIKDTLKPAENDDDEGALLKDPLRIVAISWLKTELSQPSPSSSSFPDMPNNPFSDPTTLIEDLSPLLFPVLDGNASQETASLEEFTSSLPFYTAVVNFVYFVLLRRSNKEKNHGEEEEEGGMMLPQMAKEMIRSVKRMCSRVWKREEGRGEGDEEKGDGEREREVMEVNVCELAVRSVEDVMGVEF